jgi:hypothetical protein
MLLRGAPDLPDLDPDTLDELLTEAHIELATARLMSANVEQGSNGNVFDRVRRLASTFEAYVALNLRPEQSSAAAFVAGTAHQILSRLRESRIEATLLSSDAIDSAISATLLFLIADRAADAAEIAAQLRAKGELRAVRRCLILTLRDFATGNLAAVIERDIKQDTIRQDDSREYATDLLLRECAYAIQDLANEAVSGKSPNIDIRERLAEVVSLSQASSTELGSKIKGMVYHQFAGPHHLANLLGQLVEGVQASMLVRLPAPFGANENAWNEWTKNQARSRPFLWVNHLKAISTDYLNRGQSMVMTSPTGSGKTTLSILKIAATLCAGESVIYLAPTHALVDQVEADLSGHIGDIEPVSVEDTALEELGEKLPPFSVMTPERCLALLGFAPDLFAKVGLMVFDEFHLIGADDPSKTNKINARAIDAMLALLTFLKLRPGADLLLLSAMVANGEEIARWLEGVTGREVNAFDDPWKPTRQLRSCVIYDDLTVKTAAKRASKLPTKSARKRVEVQPLGLFSLISGWHPTRSEKLVVRALTKRTPALLRNTSGRYTSNRNEVAAQIAADYAASGKRVIVFCNDINACGSVANEINILLAPASVPLDETQNEIRSAILADVGAEHAAYDPTHRRAAVHHGDLLPLERRLTESVFRARRDGEGVTPSLGLDVIAATSTIAQGLNLPCDVVVLAGTDRSSVDDPNGNPRTDLRPHEILNALGRAGRAAYSATGLSIVVPAQPILVDPDVLAFPLESVLNTVFSDQDACEEIFDPIELLLDQVEATASFDPKMQAMVRRLSSVTDDGASGFDDIVRRSFGYFRKKIANSASADKWLERRRAALEHAEDALEDPAILDWQREIAVRNGIPPKMIERLVDALQATSMETDSTADWISWLLDIIVENPLDLTIFVRETALASVFGRAYSNDSHPEVVSRLILKTLKTLTAMWCSGKSLVEIEQFLLTFIQKHEGNVIRKASRSTTAQRARRFVIRITPDLGFLCGVLGQIANHLSKEQNFPRRPIIEMLPQMIRAGDHDRHHAMLRQRKAVSSRVKTYQHCEQLRSKFTARPQSSIEEVRADVNSAIIMEVFTDFD